mmetsp:Transcript_12100/g.15442  ORF Transcript_12100/g.15442 Transcript_12100/m.15442 type:complete len:112 (-) Transcript_12100:664-999(-)
MSAIRQRVNYFGSTMWYNYLPIFSIFAPYIIKNDENFDMTTFDFYLDMTAFVTPETIKSLDSSGYFKVTISQSIKEEKIYWTRTTIITILAKLAAQMVAIYGILMPFLNGY